MNARLVSAHFDTEGIISFVDDGLATHDARNKTN